MYVNLVLQMLGYSYLATFFFFSFYKIELYFSSRTLEAE